MVADIIETLKIIQGIDQGEFFPENAFSTLKMGSCSTGRRASYNETENMYIPLKLI